MKKALFNLASGLFVLIFASSAMAVPGTPSAPSVSITSTSQTMSVNWGAVSRAVSYNVIQYRDGYWNAVKTVTTTGTNFTGTPGSVYRYAVNACDNQGECSFDSALSSSFTLHPEPYVVKFQWQPQTIYAGESTAFYWDVRNVTGCYGHTIQSGSKERPAQGNTAPAVYGTSGSADTIWECTDLYNRKYPLGTNSFLVATRTVLPPKLSTPTLSPGAGSYYPGQKVSITAPSGASVYYTTNGTTPSQSSTLYSAPFSITGTMNVKAKAIQTGMSDSDVVSASYSLKVPPVPGSLNVGIQGTNVSFNFSNVTSATSYVITPIRNGVVQPTISVPGSPYSFIGVEGLTYSFRVRACNSVGCSVDSADSAARQIPIAISAPSFSIAGGTYYGTQTLSLSVNTSGADIYYTTNGADVTKSSAIKYTAPISISTSQTIKAKAFIGDAGGTQSDQTYTISSISAPAFSLPGGTYYTTQTLNLTTSTPGAEIYYTTNGSNVVKSTAIKYTSPITISTTQTIKAKAFIGEAGGAQTSESYTIGSISATSFSVLGGTYYGPQSVSLSVNTSGAEIYYTTTGANVVKSTATKYTTPISVNSSQTIKAKAFIGDVSGSQTSQSYIIETVAAPVFSLPGGTYNTSQTLSLTVSTSGAEIYYTTDGSSVTISSAKYVSPISIPSSQTIKAKAYINGVNGPEVSAVYVINISAPDWANPTLASVSDAPVSFSAYNKISSQEIGVLAAEAGVAGGQASYSIPVQIAPGRAGMQPKIGLSYSSRGGNGIAGMGWSLQATSAISRCGSSFANDGVNRSVTLTNSDKLCYNGTALKLVSGTYGLSGAVYAPEQDDLIRISQLSGDLSSSSVSFSLTDASGQTLLFGDSNSNKVIPDGQTAALEWLLSKVTDVTGQNTMRYVYQNYGKAEVLLSHVLYTGTSSTDGAGKVEFVYENRADRSLRYLAGGAQQQSQRLSKIITSYNNSTIREYRLHYGNLSSGSSRTLLRSVTECGYMGSSAYCLEPTEFSWSEQHAGYSLEYVPYAGYQTYRTITEALPRGDLNGDGSRDWNGHFVDAEGTRQSSHNFTLPGCYFDPLRQTYICNQADFNMDGRTDGLDETGTVLRLAYTTGEGGSLSSNWINTSISLNNSTVSSLQRDRVEGFADFNGDGWPDLVMYRVNGASPDYRVYLHSRNPNNPYSGAGIVIHTPGIDINGSDSYPVTSIQLTGDMNGDGLADVVVMNSKNLSYSFPQPMPARVLYSQWNGSALSFNSVALPFASSAMQWDYFSYFIDLNNDGLTDWIGFRGIDGFKYTLNTGAGFTPLQTPTGDLSWMESRSYHAVNAQVPGEEQDIYYPKYSGAFRVMDVNNDGQPELLLPGQRLIESCISYRDFVGSSSVIKEFCGDAMYGAVRSSAASTATSPIPAESSDESIYRYDAVYFSVTPDGNLQMQRAETELIGSATQSAAIDAYGNGLDHFMFTYGSRFTSGQRFNGSTSPLGSQYGTWINRNLGDTNAGQTAMDSLVSVKDGQNKLARWSYLPLSTGQNTVAAKPLYATSHNYTADNQHFHFASSMYVVAQFSQSNGLGGENLKRYAYRGAVYNHAGKGFSGFRSVIEENVDLGVVEHADYLQKSPFTGKLQAKFRFKTAEYPAGSFATIQGWSSAFGYSGSTDDAFAVTGANNAFELTMLRWALNTIDPGRISTCTSSTDASTANESWSCGVGNSRYLTYPSHTTVVKRDLTTKAHLSVLQTKQSSVDGFGNVLTQTESLEDDYGLSNKIVTQTFDASVSWPHKLLTRRVKTDAVLNRHSSDPYASASRSLEQDSWILTSYSNFHNSRQPQNMSMTASDSSALKTVETSYNNYGLPLTVTESASTMDLSGNWQAVSSRTTTMEYGDTVARANGAYVYKVTNAKNHSSIIKTLPAFGLPSSKTDANGLVTTYQYDAFGRLIQQQEPAAGERYITLDEARYDGNAPDAAISVQVMQQKGMPEQRVYFDMLGREVRSAIKGFNGDWINQDKVYDTLGRISQESLPYEGGGSPSWTEYLDYDELNRPGEKVTHDNRLHITYSYDGLQTDINAGGIVMSRSYNSLNQLMETVDGEGGITRYSYNGLGLPVVMRDANGVLLQASYNAMGMKVQVDDPNQGTSQYVYNGYGELEQETDANAVVKYHDYDVLGREVALKAVKAGVVKEQFSYSFDASKKGQPDSESSGNIVRSFGYDSKSRLVNNSLQVDGEVFTQLYGYHAETGQLKSYSYPNGLTVAYEYNQHGYAQLIKNAASNYVYRHISAQDAFGHITAASLGNGITESRSYDAGTGWVQQLEAVSSGVTVHQLSYSQYDSFGNLKYYSNNATNVSESFQYDDVHRLLQSTTNGAGATVNLSYSYDAVGNMQSKSDYGSGYLYGNSGKSLGGNAGPNAVRQVTKSGGAVVNFSYDNEGNLLTGDGLTISYTSFKQPSSISRSGNSFSFGYGARLERVKEVRNSLTTYEIDKAYEKSSDGSWKLYLDDVAIISHSSADGHRIAYSHKDRLGSSVTFTDHNGQVTGRRHYDAFGKPRQISGALMEPAHRPKQLNFSHFAGVDNAGITRRGFTDHRHLDEAELIHMNGRAYDYNLGRFLSVDPFIQSPTNSQSLNPYSYGMNNPLAGTDPTGYVFVVLVPLIEIGGGALGLYGSWEAGQTIGNAINDISSGEKATSDVLMDAGKSLAVDGIMTATGTRLAKFAPKSFTDKVDRLFKNNGADSTVETSSGNAVDIGDKKAELGVVYERTNPKTGECYIGQCKSPERFEERKKEHDKKLGVKHDYKIVDRAEAGDSLDVAEHNKIQEKTGGIRAKDSNAVQNKKDPVGPARQKKLGVAAPTKVTGVVAVTGKLDSIRLKELDKLKD